MAGGNPLTANGLAALNQALNGVLNEVGGDHAGATLLMTEQDRQLIAVVDERYAASWTSGGKLASKSAAAQAAQQAEQDAIRLEQLRSEQQAQQEQMDRLQRTERELTQLRHVALERQAHSTSLQAEHETVRQHAQHMTVATAALAQASEAHDRLAQRDAWRAAVAAKPSSTISPSNARSSNGSPASAARAERARTADQ